MLSQRVLLLRLQWWYLNERVLAVDALVRHPFAHERLEGGVDCPPR